MFTSSRTYENAPIFLGCAQQKRNARRKTGVDYSTFGAQMDGRLGGEVYRYDFNGKETDQESDLQDYGLRIYNARLGKFLSIDPLTQKYPELTPYQFAANTPILCIDVNGGEPSPEWRLPYGSAAFKLMVWGEPTELSLYDIRWVYDLKTNRPIVGGRNMGAALFNNSNVFYSQTATTNPWVQANNNSLAYNHLIKHGVTGTHGYFQMTTVQDEGDVPNMCVTNGAIEIFNQYSGVMNLSSYQAHAQYQAHAFALNSAYSLVYNANLPLGFTDDQSKVDLVNYIVDGSLPEFSINNTDPHNDYITMIAILGDWLYANRDHPYATFYPQDTYAIMYESSSVTNEELPSWQQDQVRYQQPAFILFYMQAKATNDDFAARYDRYRKWKDAHPRPQATISDGCRY